MTSVFQIFLYSPWVCASTVLGNELRLVDTVNRFSDLAAQLCSEITWSDLQQVRNKMESLEEGKLEINFQSFVVIFEVWALLSSIQKCLVRFLETIPCHFQRLCVCRNPGFHWFSTSCQSEEMWFMRRDGLPSGGCSDSCSLCSFILLQRQISCLWSTCWTATAWLIRENLHRFGLFRLYIEKTWLLLPCQQTYPCHR